MARQKLINLHSSGTTVTSLYTGDDALELGEIAVQHVDGKAKLHIRVSNDQGAIVASKLASFIDESAIDKKISTAVGGVSSDVDALKEALGAGFDLTHTVAKAIQDEAAARESGDTELQTDISLLTETLSAETVAREATDARLSAETRDREAADLLIDGRLDTAESDIASVQAKLSGITGTVKEYVDNTVSAITDALDSVEAATPADGDLASISVSQKTNRKQTIGVSLTVVDVSASSVSNKGLAEASDVKSVTDALDGRLDTAENKLDTIQGQLTGFDSSTSSVINYVDNAVSTAIASVYKVKGSVATYGDLPESGQSVGDVYNVIAAYSTYPAGTNWVWTGTEWDALGGTIDLSPYMLVSDFNTYSAATKTKIEGIEGRVSTLETGLSTETTARENADNAINAKFGEGISSSSTVASKISAEATARENEDSRLNNLITAETKTRKDDVAEVSAATGTLRQDIDNEITRATSAETSLRNSIDAEVSARTSADTELRSSISSANTQVAQLRTDLSDEISARTSADTQLRTSINSAVQDITDIKSQLGTGFKVSSVTEQLAAVKTTADSAVQSVAVANTGTNLITATKSGTTVTLNFDNMVIDCGTY